MQAAVLTRTPTSPRPPRRTPQVAVVEAQEEELAVVQEVERAALEANLEEALVVNLGEALLVNLEVKAVPPTQRAS